jgi:hypothetical protein
MIANALATLSLFAVVGCCVVLVVLIVCQARLERRWADDDRRRSDARFARQRPVNRPGDSTRWHQ